MNKKTKNRLIIAMAYMHRYGWIVLMLLAAWLIPVKGEIVIGVSALLFSVWSLCGYLFKWKHFYCSYQNSGHHDMTPDEIDWDEVDKKDAYGIPIIFSVLGILVMFC